MKTLILSTYIRGVVSNEETIWSVLAENLPNSEAISLVNLKEDLEIYLVKEKPRVIILNSILGDIKVPLGTKKIVFLQDNFAAMRKLLPVDWKRVVKWFMNFGRDEFLIKERIQRNTLANADVIVANSKNTANSYGLNKVEIIPVGTDADLFKSLPHKDALKKKYGIPENRRIKIFVGSTHKVKGFDILKEEIKNDKESFYILVLKDKFIPGLKFSNAKIFQRISQNVLVELHNCADVYVGRSRVETLWLGPIEAMFCGVPVDVTKAGFFADWQPKNKNPRLFTADFLYINTYLYKSLSLYKSLFFYCLIGMTMYK